MSAPVPDRSGFGGRDLIVAAVMNVMWGLNIIAIKLSVAAMGPLTAGVVRQLIVAALCLPALKLVPGRMRALLALGVLSGGLFYVAINLSLAVADNVSALAIAGQLGVPFSLLLAVVVLGERIHWPRMTGIALSFGGVALLAFDPAAVHELPGIALTALASAIWAVCSLIQRALKDVGVATIYAWIGLCGSLVQGALALAIDPAGLAALPTLPLGAFGWVAFSAIGSTLIGQGSMSWLLQRHPISTGVPFTLAAPVISVAAAAWFFATPLSPLVLAGGAIALSGIAIVTIRTAQPVETQ